MSSIFYRVDVDSSDESDIDDDLDQPTIVKSKHHDLMMKSEGSRKGSFFKQAKKSYPMFPTHEERIKWDEYGEIIRCVNTGYRVASGETVRKYADVFMLSLLRSLWAFTGWKISWFQNCKPQRRRKASLIQG